jgi:hypothetical protein
VAAGKQQPTSKNRHPIDKTTQQKQQSTDNNSEPRNKEQCTNRTDNESDTVVMKYKTHYPTAFHLALPLPVVANGRMSIVHRHVVSSFRAFVASVGSTVFKNNEGGRWKSFRRVLSL